MPGPIGTDPSSSPAGWCACAARVPGALQSHSDLTSRCDSHQTNPRGLVRPQRPGPPPEPPFSKHIKCWQDGDTGGPSFSNSSGLDNPALVPVFISQGCQNRATQSGRLKQQPCVVSQFWWPEVQNQGVGRALEVLRETLSQVSPSSW